MHTHLIEAICIFMKKNVLQRPEILFFWIIIIIIEQCRSGNKAIVIIVALCRRDSNGKKRFRYMTARNQNEWILHIFPWIRNIYICSTCTQAESKKMIEGRTKTKLKLILNMHLTSGDGFIQSIDPNLHFYHHLFSLHCRFDFFYYQSTRSIWPCVRLWNIFSLHVANGADIFHSQTIV